MSFSFRFKSTHFKALLSDSSGFTLMEVLISIALLLVISLSIYQATTQTFRLRDSLSNEGDFHNGIRLAMSIVGRDVTLLYSPHLLKPEPQTSPTPGGTPAGAPPAASAATLPQDQFEGEDAQSFQFWSPMIDKTGIRPSHFIGNENSMSFVTTGHIRIYRDSPSSEFAKVTYELQNDPDSNRDNPTQVLVKTENPNAFDLDDRPTDRARAALKQIYRLLPGIKKLSFRYYSKDKGWQRSWDSEKIEENQVVFPDAVEINVEVHGPANLKFQGAYLFRPEIPLIGLQPTT